jgi:hypothetical protein|tara:strand:+ start:434 stop:691 length:258 start_codon:yes stop_codon:yes gene_type:complete
MESTKTKQPEDQVVITYNDKQYRASDLNEEQMAIAAKLNVAGRKLARLQEAYDDYVITNEYKNLCIESFDRAINAKEEVEVVEEK